MSELNDIVRLCRKGGKGGGVEHGRAVDGTHCSKVALTVPR